MMALLAKKVLSIALGARSLQAAEMHANGRGTLVRTTEFEFEPDDLKQPQALGKKLAAFLKQNSFSATQAVVGIPAQWLMFKEKNVPPAAPAMLQTMLALQAERDFSIEPAALAVDYLAGSPSGGSQPILLAAMLRERLDQIKAMSEAAGLKLQAVTSTALALADASKKPALLYVSASGVELALRQSSGLYRLRQITSNSADFAGELRRALALTEHELSGEVAVFDDVGAPPESLSEVERELKVSVKKGSPLCADSASANGCAALAVTQFQTTPARIDFLHSRLVVQRKSKVGKRAIWGSVAAFVALIGVAYLVLDWRESVTEVAELREKRKEMKENIDVAKAFINQVNSTSTWYDNRPNYLECLRAITLSFPEEAGRVWTSSMTLRDDMRGILSGRATDEKSVLDVLDKMKASGNFSDIKMLHIRGSGAKNAEFSFGISFVFLGGKKS